MYTPELFEMTWNSTHAERIVDCARLRMAFVPQKATFAANVGRWFLPLLCVLIISASLAYPANAILTAKATPVPTPELYMGLGIEPELEAQTPDQLAAAPALSDPR
jgi:hypothetical protein